MTIKSLFKPLVTHVSRWQARLNGGVDYINGYDDGEAEKQRVGFHGEAFNPEEERELIALHEYDRRNAIF
jgi:hypothetical protein